MRHEAAAVRHFGDKRHRQLRWRTFMRRQSAYAAICRDISAGSKDTVVAYGDASFSSSCCKGNPSTPTVSLRRCLGYHCKVYDTDEYRTSRLCCACNTAMPGMPLPVTGNLLPCATAVPLCFRSTTFLLTRRTRIRCCRLAAYMKSGTCIKHYTVPFCAHTPPLYTLVHTLIAATVPAWQCG